MDGAEAGNSYKLAWLGKFAWENSVANPHTGDKTVVAGTDDATPGQLYFYFGDKQATGSALDKAGLTYGTLYGLKVTEWASCDVPGQGLIGRAGRPSFNCFA
ncbi:MAG: hypothetical protein ACXWU8_05335 [Rhodoplanes sp.]